MKAFKFRIVIDVNSDETIFRDILIRENQTFEDFHEAIQTAYNFQGGVMASFYLSNEEWDKGEEIALMNMADERGKGPKMMDSTLISDVIENIDQKLIYVYDFMRMWCFYVELIEIEDANSVQQYPLLAMSFGDAPLEDSKDIDLGEMPMMNLEDEEGLEDEIGGMFNDFGDEDY